MRFNDIYGKWQIKILTAEQAAEILGIHKRTFRPNANECVFWGHLM